MVVSQLATTIKGWREEGDRLSITNNQHAPNTYTKFYLIKDNLFKLSGWDLPWLTRYHPLSLTMTTISWPNRKGHHNRFTINGCNTLLWRHKNSICHASGYKIGRPQRSSRAEHDVGKQSCTHQRHGHFPLIMLIIQFLFETTIFLSVVSQ